MYGRQMFNFIIIIGFGETVGIASINIWFALVNKYVILEWHILENLAPQVLAPLVLSDSMQIDIKWGVIKENRIEYWYTVTIH